MHLRSLVGFVAWLGLPLSFACSPSGGNGTTSGTPSSSGGTAASAGSGGALGGSSAGNAGQGGQAGSTGGSPEVPAGGAAGAATTGGGAGSPGAGSGGAGGSGPPTCPADATFCSGFEDPGLPASAVYKYNAAPGEWTRDFELDSTVFHSGKAALRVKSASTDAGASGAYQMLAVPAPSGTFWARFYVRQDELDIGGLDHNVFAGAAASDEPNSPLLEVAEDVGLAFNMSDDVRWPSGFGRINGNPMPFTLAQGSWHCIEVSFDAMGRHQQLFVEGTQIDASEYPSSMPTLQVFKFGFNRLHGPPRTIWYDDVAVGPTRAGCPGG